MDYTKHFKTKKDAKTVPQSEKLPGTAQVKNNAGGYAWRISDFDRLDRFLVLGSEGPTYYTGEKKLTKDNAKAVQRAIKEDGSRVVRRVVEISDAGRAPKNDPAIFVLAMAAKLGDEQTKRDAFAALPKVCRTGTHLFHWAGAMEAFGGWGRGTKNAVARWYNGLPADRFALQAVKYQSRDGWSHRDLIRLAHIKPATENHGEIVKWILSSWKGEPIVPKKAKSDLSLIWAFEKAKTASEKELVKLITDYRLPHEAIPTEMKNSKKVWEALLPSMGITALIRNLAKMTNVGLLEQMSDASKFVQKQIKDAELLKKGRVHPIQLLSALKTYAQGHGERGKMSWVPVQKVVDALDAGFYLSFGAVEKTGKRWVLGCDISGSMDSGVIAGVPGLTPRIASAAMALITSAVEDDTVALGFTSGGGYGYGARDSQANVDKAVTVMNISPRQRLDNVISYMQGLPMGGTDCAVPILWALKHKIKADVFVTYTDNETWDGAIHPSEALKRYRQETGIPAKLIACGMTATEYSIADENDPGMMNVVGFDSATPSLMADFATRDLG